MGAEQGLRRAEREREERENLAPSFLATHGAPTCNKSRARVLWEPKALDLDLDLDQI